MLQVSQVSLRVLHCKPFPPKCHTVLSLHSKILNTLASPHVPVALSLNMQAPAPLSLQQGSALAQLNHQKFTDMIKNKQEFCSVALVSLFVLLANSACGPFFFLGVLKFPPSRQFWRCWCNRRRLPHAPHHLTPADHAMRSIAFALIICKQTTLSNNGRVRDFEQIVVLLFSIY